MEVVNVVSAGSLGREFDIDSVAVDIQARYVNTAKEEYGTPTVYVKRSEDSPLVTLYRSGSYHISGAESNREAEKAFEWFVEALEKMGVEMRDTSFEVKNIVLVGNLEREVDLHSLVALVGVDVVEYEPEQFPGLVYRPPDGACVLLVFSSGRVVVTGSADIKVAEQKFESLRAHLSELGG